MRRTRQLTDHDPEFDPFGEHLPSAQQFRMSLLGADFGFICATTALARVVQAAYGGLPRPRSSKAGPELTVSLRLSGHVRSGRRNEPEPLVLSQGQDILAAGNATASFAVVAPKSSTALVTVAPAMLRHPYHVRYELLEFAVYTLGARAQRLVPLHAACVGRNGRGVLLMGDSGSGKSTLALLCALAGFEFLSEDSAFLAPASMRAFGIANYLHVRSSSLRWLQANDAQFIRRSPTITRRSGVKKFEVDLRKHDFKLARPPLRVAAVAYLSARPARSGQLLQALRPRAARARLAALQSYATGQLGWQRFLGEITSLEHVELARGAHPLDGVAALDRLLRA